MDSSTWNQPIFRSNVISGPSGLDDQLFSLFVSYRLALNKKEIRLAGTKVQTGPVT